MSNNDHRVAVEARRAAMLSTNDRYNELVNKWRAIGGRLSPKNARIVTELIGDLWLAVEAERKAGLAVTESGGSGGHGYSACDRTV